MKQQAIAFRNQRFATRPSLDAIAIAPTGTKAIAPTGTRAIARENY
ncbi:MAG: hypothetical protein AB4352_08250 [Hormoscilla sp.]